MPLAMIILTKADFRCVTIIRFCVWLHDFLAKNLGIFSRVPCDFLCRISRVLDEKYFKSKAEELGKKKGVILFPVQTGFHPYLDLIRKFSSIQPIDVTSVVKSANP